MVFYYRLILLAPPPTPFSEFKMTKRRVERVKDNMHMWNHAIHKLWESKIIYGHWFNLQNFAHPIFCYGHYDNFVLFPFGLKNSSKKKLLKC